MYSQRSLELPKLNYQNCLLGLLSPVPLRRQLPIQLPRVPLAVTDSFAVFQVFTMLYFYPL